MAARSRKQNYQSKKRLILVQWVQLVRQQKAFCKVVSTVVTKSLCHSGFQSIHNKAR